MQNRVRWLVPDCPADTLEGDFTFSCLMRQHTQHMERIGLVRLDTKHLQIDRFGLRNMSRAMMADREAQRLIDSKGLWGLCQFQIAMGKMPAIGYCSHAPHRAETTPERGSVHCAKTTCPGPT